MGSEQRTLPRPPPEMKQPLPTTPEAIAQFNTSMAAYYNQVSFLLFFHQSNPWLHSVAVYHTVHF